MEFVVLGNPVTKKNSMQIVKNKKTGRWFPVQSKVYKTFRNQALKQLEATGEPINTPVNICYTFYMDNHRRVDGLNLCAAMDDVLVEAGILTDDNRDIVAGHDGTRVYYDKDNPRTEVNITELTNYEQWKRD